MTELELSFSKLLFYYYGHSFYTSDIAFVPYNSNYYMSDVFKYQLNDLSSLRNIAMCNHLLFNNDKIASIFSYINKFFDKFSTSATEDIHCDLLILEDYLNELRLVGFDALNFDEHSFEQEEKVKQLYSISFMETLKTIKEDLYLIRDDLSRFPYEATDEEKKRHKFLIIDKLNELLFFKEQRYELQRCELIKLLKKLLPTSSYIHLNLLYDHVDIAYIDHADRLTETLNIEHLSEMYEEIISSIEIKKFFLLSRLRINETIIEIEKILQLKKNTKLVDKLLFLFDLFEVESDSYDNFTNFLSRKIKNKKNKMKLDFLTNLKSTIDKFKNSQEDILKDVENIFSKFNKNDRYLEKKSNRRYNTDLLCLSYLNDLPNILDIVDLNFELYETLKDGKELEKDILNFLDVSNKYSIDLFISEISLKIYDQIKTEKINVDSEILNNFKKFTSYKEQLIKSGIPNSINVEEFKDFDRGAFDCKEFSYQLDKAIDFLSDFYKSYSEKIFLCKTHQECFELYEEIIDSYSFRNAIIAENIVRNKYFDNPYRKDIILDIIEQFEILMNMFFFEKWKQISGISSENDKNEEEDSIISFQSPLTEQTIKINVFSFIDKFTNLLKERFCDLSRFEIKDTDKKIEIYYKFLFNPINRYYLKNFLKLDILKNINLDVNNPNNLKLNDIFKNIENMDMVVTIGVLNNICLLAEYQIVFFMLFWLLYINSLVTRVLSIIGLTTINFETSKIVLEAKRKVISFFMKSTFDDKLEKIYKRDDLKLINLDELEVDVNNKLSRKQMEILFEYNLINIFGFDNFKKYFIYNPKMSLDAYINSLVNEFESEKSKLLNLLFKSYLSDSLKLSDTILNNIFNLPLDSCSNYLDSFSSENGLNNLSSKKEFFFSHDISGIFKNEIFDPFCSKLFNNIPKEDSGIVSLSKLPINIPKEDSGRVSLSKLFNNNPKEDSGIVSYIKEYTKVFIDKINFNNDYFLHFELFLLFLFFLLKTIIGYFNYFKPDSKLDLLKNFNKFLSLFSLNVKKDISLILKYSLRKGVKVGLSLGFGSLIVVIIYTFIFYFYSFAKY